MSEISILKETLELAEKGIKLALVTVTSSQGSTPGVVGGAQMTVLEDGSIIGTVGGGALEKKEQLSCHLRL